MTDHAVTTRNLVARAWHAGSDHADHSPFGGPLCNCDQVAGRMLPMLRDAFDDGFDAGWAAQDPDDHTPNPYETAIDAISRIAYPEEDHT